jgi:hypothetical protein
MGLYAVYENHRTHSLNADWPSPKLPQEVNGIAVPASEAGRRLPNDATFVGWSFQPVGLITPEAGNAMGEMDLMSSRWAPIGVGAAAGGVLGLLGSRPLLGAVAGALAGGALSAMRGDSG